MSAALVVFLALGVAPAAQAANPLTLTSRVDSVRDYVGVIGPRTAIADFNGDGIDDHAIASTNLVTVYFGSAGSADGGGTLRLPANFSNTVSPGVSAAGDPDGDGFDDFIITPSIGATRAILVYGAASNPASLALGTANPRITNITIGAWGPQVQTAMGIGDFTGDGKDDLIVPSMSGSGSSAGTASVAIVAGGPRVAALSAVAAGSRVSLLLGFRSCKNVFSIFVPGFYRQDCRTPEPTVMPVGDFNGDGNTDLYVDGKTNLFPSIVLGRAGTGATISAVSPGAGSTSLSAIQASNSAAYVGSATRLGDVDGDRFDDFALPINASLGGGTAVIRGRANPPATLPATGSVLRPTAAAGVVAGAAGDQTGDGRADLLMNQGNTSLAIASWPANASAFALTPVVGFPNGGGTPSNSTGDLDGDGATDLTLSNETAAFRFTHSGAAVQPRVEIKTTIRNAEWNVRYDVAQTVAATCEGATQTQTGINNDIFTFGADGSISAGDRCTFKTTQTLPSGRAFENCVWATNATFRGVAVDPNAPVTIGTDPNRWTQELVCNQPAPEPPADAAITTLSQWTGGGSAYGSSGILTNAANSTGSLVWPKPIDVNGKAISFTMTMNGGNGAAEGLTLAFLNTAGGVPAAGLTGGLLGAGGGQLGFGGLSGSAVAFDVFKQADDAAPNTVNWVDGAQGTSLRKLYSKDAGLRLRGTSIAVRVVINDGKVTVTLNGKFVHSITATLPSSVFVGFTASTGPSIWQWQSISGFSITDL